MKDPTAQTAKASTLLVRLLVGQVFFFEGIQKFLFPDALGVGRFMHIGIPAPEIMAPFVGVVEVVGGAFVLIGLFTRLASVPLLIDICVAIATTKIPILLHSGFWAMMHESRVDFSMVFGLLFILITGAPGWSIDSVIGKNKTD